MKNLSVYDSWRALPVHYDDAGLLIGAHQVMQYWERPLMRRLAELATRRGGHILEVGFGLGVSANCIMSHTIDSYTVIEAHPAIAEKARNWGSQQDVPVTIIEGPWQDRLSSLPRKYDGILFDTFPLSAEERGKNHYPFIAEAADILTARGILTYYSDETSDFRHDHLGLLLKHFKCVELHYVGGLNPPLGCTYWQNDHMIIPCASRAFAAET